MWYKAHAEKKTTNKKLKQILFFMYMNHKNI